ncbi:multidrug efflux protein [Scheffersomyces coipomensis]|uniref:multidrug efflux protein n=1 Tax=Scheffersomyces coipomensis TaxID=1788519 RepID=UPI00315D6233
MSDVGQVTSRDGEREYMLETAANEIYGAMDSDIEDEDLDEDALWFREELDKHKSLPLFSRPSVLMACILFFLSTIALSIGTPPLQVVLYKLSCNTVAINGACDPVAAQVLFSTFTQYDMILTSILPIAASAKVGELSDKYGRKPFVALIISAFFVNKFVNYFLLTRSTILPFKRLLFVNFICTVFGSGPTIIALLSSYITDVVEAHQRIFAIGLCTASYMVGQSLGPILSNLLVSFANTESSPIGINSVHATIEISKKQLIPLRIEVIVFLVLAIYSIFIFPESRGEKAQSRSRTSSVVSQLDPSLSSNAFEQLRALEQPSLYIRIIRILNVFKPLMLLTYPSSIVPPNQKHKEKRNRFVVISLISITTLYLTSHVTLAQMVMQYSMIKFNFESEELGYLLTISSSVASFMLIIGSPIISNTILQKGFGLKVMKRQFDMIDFCIVAGGRCIDIIAFSFMILSVNSGQFYLSNAIYGLGAPASPAISSALLKFYPASKTGEFFGAISLMQSLLSLLISTGMMEIFKFGIAHRIPQIIFMLYLIISLVYLIILVISKVILRLDSKSTDETLIRSNSSISLASSSVTLS